MSEVLNTEQQWCVANSIIHAVEMSTSVITEEMTVPHVRMRPEISLDGNKWCALYGQNLQDGVSGFGDSPYEAMKDFDKAWYAKLVEQAK